MGGAKLETEPIHITNSADDPIINQQVLDTIAQQITPGTVKLAGEEWFDPTVDPPFPINRAASCRVEFIFKGNDARISFTYDNTNYAEIEEGVVLKGGSLYSKITSVETGNIFNIKADQDVTIDKCIMSVIGQQIGSQP